MSNNFVIIFLLLEPSGFIIIFILMLRNESVGLVCENERCRKIGNHHDKEIDYNKNT